MRALRFLAPGLLLSCGAAPPAPPPPSLSARPPEPSLDSRQYAARGLPGLATRRALFVASPGSDAVELYALNYGLVALGWATEICASDARAVSGRGGVPIPIDAVCDQADPKRFELLVVTGGAPLEGSARGLVYRFGTEGAIATTGAGAANLSRAGLDVDGRLATDDGMVRIDGNLLSAARPGDIPGLLHAIDTWASDRSKKE